MEARALEGVAQQVERNLELATRRAVAAEQAVEQLRAEVARLTRENKVCRVLLAVFCRCRMFQRFLLSFLLGAGELVNEPGFGKGAHGRQPD